jgi:beta-phosphoglucomutase-like phosphatase (HAD superfamily)
MVTAFDVKHGKPHPEPYLMGLEKAGVSASEAIVIENAPLGVEAAHAAGIYTIAVNTGPLSPKVLLDAGADIVLPREGGFAQALEIINGGL